METLEKKTFIGGFISGILQSIIGHPLDTIKVIKQSNKVIRYHQLFNGLLPVMLSNSIITGIQFYSYQNYNPILLGLNSALLITPIDYYKTQKQIFGKYKVELPKGFGITFAREFIALNFYFRTYDFLEKKVGVFIAGGLAGSSSWLMSYSIDTIKTRVQTGKTYQEAIYMKKYHNGLSFCLLRGFIINAIGFYGASLSQNLI